MVSPFTSLLAVSLLLCGASLHAAETAALKPNILVILADDLGFSDLGCYGSEIATPHLDRLAAGGLRFAQFYNTARCWPTRSSLLSGYYPQQIRMDPPARRPSPGWLRTLPQRLRDGGYRSYHSGKWHFFGRLDPVSDAGFDRSDEVGHANNYFEPRQTQGVDPAPANFYSTTAITDHAIECLQEHHREHPGLPFFSYVAYFAPHFPVQAPAEDVARQKGRYDVGWDVIRERRQQKLQEMGVCRHALPPRDETLSPRYWKPAVVDALGPGEVRYAVAWESLTDEQRRFQAAKMEVHAAMVERLDGEVGRIIGHLDAIGQLENTLICFLSDNGADATILVRGNGHDPRAPAGSAASYLCIGPGWATACNSPFHRHKVWVHEGGIATPLIVHWPTGIAARGEWRRDVGHVIDLLPTFLDVAGRDAAFNAGPPLLGRSLRKTFTRDTNAERSLYFHHERNRALREGDWKIVSAHEDGSTWRLYDLSRDRGETQDLGTLYPARLRTMAELWEAMSEQFARDAGLAPEEQYLPGFGRPPIP
ncbi:MAG: arylsulfatase [Planctomycetota bacterium]